MMDRGYDDYRGRTPPDYRGSKRMRSPSPTTGDLNPRFLPPGAPEPPDELDYKVTRRYYRDWLQYAKPKIAADDAAFENAWQHYEISFKRRDVERVFNKAKKDSWFQEKYNPSKNMAEMRARNKAKGRSGKLQKFLAELDDLKELSFDYPERKPNNDGATSVGENGVTKEADHDKVEDATVDAKPEKQEDVALQNTRDNVDFVEIPASECTVLLRDLAPTVTREELEDASLCTKLASFEYLALGAPEAAKDYARSGWAVFGQVADATTAATELSASKLGIKAVVAENPKKARTKAAPSLASAPERIATDLDNVRRAALSFEKEEGDSRGSSAIEERFEKAKAELEQETDEDVSKARLESLARQTLDLYLHYLRTVFNSCFYCLSTFEYAEELCAKCPKHLRRQLQPNAIRTKPEELTWTRWFDERVPLFADRENVNPLDFGGKDYDAAVEAMASAHYKEEEPGKYRCTGCSKLFSAHKFIIKHLFTKHGDIFDQAKLDEIKFFNNYALDPVRIPLQTPFDTFTETGLRERTREAKSLSERFGHKVEDGGSAKRRRRAENGGKTLPPPPPPKGVKLDPRASRGMSSYADLDNAPAGASDDIVLQY
ncbi:hypothetical protein OIV83_000058 [Microbotryomycetes sp. JL201]|nr:hypothetical protein OIV83_000058 [Microbotryomycetes sp. JL201]